VRSGPAWLQPAAASDVLPPAIASSNAHISPVALRFSPAVAADSSATISRFLGAAPVAAIDCPGCRPVHSTLTAVGPSGSDGSSVGWERNFGNASKNNIFVALVEQTFLRERLAVIIVHVLPTIREQPAHKQKRGRLPIPQPISSCDAGLLMRWLGGRCLLGAVPDPTGSIRSGSSRVQLSPCARKHR